jgi:hypothetical protein
MELDHEHSYIFCMKFLCKARITCMLVEHIFEVLFAKFNAFNITTSVNYNKKCVTVFCNCMFEFLFLASPSI